MNDFLRAQLHYWYSQLLTRIHLDERAIVQLHHAVAADPQNMKSWRSLGFMLGNLGRDTDAIEVLERVLAIEDDAVTRFNLGFLYHGQKRTTEAISQFKQVVTAMPVNDRAWYGLGICLQELGDFAGSVEPLQEAARLQFFNPHAGYHLGLAWHRLGEQEKCAAELERVKSFDPNMAAQMHRDFVAS